MKNAHFPLNVAIEIARGVECPATETGLRANEKWKTHSLRKTNHGKIQAEKKPDDVDK